MTQKKLYPSKRLLVEDLLIGAGIFAALLLLLWVMWVIVVE